MAAAIICAGRASRRRVGVSTPSGAGTGSTARPAGRGPPSPSGLEEPGTGGYTVCMGSHTSAGHTRAVLDAVRRIVHALGASSRWAEKHVGLTGAQLFVLQKLAESPDPLSLNELAARTHTHQSSVSTVVARLAARGLVQRRRSETDRRALKLTLAGRGRQLTSRAPDVAQDRLIRAVERLSPSRQRQLASTLTELAHHVDAGAGAPGMFFEEHGRRRG